MVLGMLTNCSEKNKIKLIDGENFEKEIGGENIMLFTLQNSNGMTAQITNFGGRVVALWVSDSKGKFEDIVMGYDNIDGYLNSKEAYFGALIGRYGNRIANGMFSIDSVVYNLDRNNGDNQLHGGPGGFHNVIWDAKQIDPQTLRLEYFSKDTEEGYPGNLHVKVIYKVTDSDELIVEYFATTDKPTYINLTHHSFFNLTGDMSKSINDHIMMINAMYYTPVDEGLIPTGELATVENTPMDFRIPTIIGERINENFQQLIYGRGYDHNWVLDKGSEKTSLAAKVVEPISGRVIEVFTNEPGMQFYGGNFLDGSDIGKGGVVYNHRTAFCLETQHFPDSPNQPNFPTTLLNPGEEYYSVCIYRFLSE